MSVRRLLRQMFRRASVKSEVICVQILTCGEGKVCEVLKGEFISKKNPLGL